MSLFPTSPAGRNGNTVHVFQIDHASVLDGILSGNSSPPNPKNRQKLMLSSPKRSSFDEITPRRRTASDDPTPRRRTVIDDRKRHSTQPSRRISTPDDGGKRLLVGSSLSPKKKSSHKRVSMPQGIKEYFHKNKSGL